MQQLNVRKNIPWHCVLDRCWEEQWCSSVNPSAKKRKTRLLWGSRRHPTFWNTPACTASSFCKPRSYNQKNEEWWGGGLAKSRKNRESQIMPASIPAITVGSDQPSSSSSSSSQNESPHDTVPFQEPQPKRQKLSKAGLIQGFNKNEKRGARRAVFRTGVYEEVTWSFCY